jgi:outer membrane lipoprotein
MPCVTNFAEATASQGARTLALADYVAEVRKIPDLDKRAHMALSVAFALALCAGCAGSQLVPSDMEGRVSRDIPFQALQAEPDAFRGRWVVLGGKVLSSKRLKDETQIEGLQLPLDQTDRPIPILTRSVGRFLAVQEEFLDPAAVPAGTLVSLVGEVIGGRKMPLDELTYQFPVVRIKTLKVWPEPSLYGYPGGYPYPYWRRRYPFWLDPFWGPYPYW